MNLVFFEITIILIIASFLSVLFRFIKQPPILSYILAGIIIGPLGLMVIESKDVVRAMAEIGITLLLFMIGLELRIPDLKSIGKVALITGIAQIIFTSVIGFIISLALGFGVIPSLYIAVALTFSSTIIIVKLLSDKKDLNSLYGKISVGFLLVQDLFAIIVLILLSGFAVNGGGVKLLEIAIVLSKGLALFLAVLFLSKNILPSLLNKIARSPETLFLFSIAWAFGISALVASPMVGFSIEIGGFLAGLALANSSESFHISSRIRSLRDFFIIIFFVTLGMGMTISDIGKVLVPGLLLSAFVLIGNPIIVMSVMGLLGYKKRTSFLAGLTVAQISEFSLILVFLGNKLNHLSDEVVALVTLVGLITFSASTYMIMNGNQLYKILSRFLDIFEKSNKSGETQKTGELKDHVVLAGVNRAGNSILQAVLSESGQKIIAVDFNPDVVKKLIDENVLAVFGDIADLDIMNHTQIDKAKIVVSTVSDIEDNLHLMHGVKSTGSKAKIIVIAQDKTDAMALYEAGADYVVIPHLISGRYIGEILKEENLDLLETYRKHDLANLEKE